MLAEAELRELQDMPFDLMLLQLWPKCDSTRTSIPHCRSCGMKREKTGRLGARGLCVKCYDRWYHCSRTPGYEDTAIAMNPGPIRRSGFKEYEDLLMAKRIGVCIGTMYAWRNGKKIPLMRTIRRTAPELEREFGVPAHVWLEALAVSHLARGRQPSIYGAEFSMGARYYSAAWRPRGPHRDPTGLQYGYWVVLNVADDRYNRQVYVRARCLLCKSVHEVMLDTLLRGGSSKCISCTNRLRDPKFTASGFKGVHKYVARGARDGRWKVSKSTTGAAYKSFTDPAEAARYYDACMYERYGHTLFLNFPDEYDQSNDPVFIPVGKAAA